MKHLQMVGSTPSSLKTSKTYKNANIFIPKLYLLGDHLSATLLKKSLCLRPVAFKFSHHT